MDSLIPIMHRVFLPQLVCVRLLALATLLTLWIQSPHAHTHRCMVWHLEINYDNIEYGTSPLPPEVGPLGNLPPPPLVIAELASEKVGLPL